MPVGGVGGAPSCVVCEQRVYFNEEKTFMGRTWHKKCFRCTDCNKQLESGTANLFEEEAVLCNACFRKKTAASKPKAPKEEYINREDPDCCPRCGKRVYFAERVPCLGRDWHKACFSCASCSKKLEPAIAADHHGDLFCRACYGRKFGPKGYGFAGGAGTGLSMDTGKRNQTPTDNVPLTAKAYVAPVAEMGKLAMEGDGETEGEVNGENGERPAAAPRWGGGEYCPRCNKQVFIAERKQAAGNVYHIKCFACRDCSKRLDSGSLAETKTEIYCKICYGKHFGPKGYGFGAGAGALHTA